MPNSCCLMAGEDKQVAHGEEHMTNTVALDDGLTRVLMSRTNGRTRKLAKQSTCFSFFPCTVAA